MSVPLDRLYNFLHDVVDHDITIYRFWPHGSKKLEHLEPITENENWVQNMTRPMVIFHDQEPLNFYQWSPDNFSNWWNCRIIQNNLNKLYQQMELQIDYTKINKTSNIFRVN